jgi:hypothetical protein
MAVANTPTYYDTATITTVKSFIVHHFYCVNVFLLLHCYIVIIVFTGLGPDSIFLVEKLFEY